MRIKKPSINKIIEEQMNVRPGDVFWVSPNESNGIASDPTHPYLVIQDGHSDTVVICALTSNLKRAKEPGNILLEEGEANSPKQSVVMVSQACTVDRTQLGEHIGRLAEQRIKQVMAGISFLQAMTQHHEKEI